MLIRSLPRKSGKGWLMTLSTRCYTWQTRSGRYKLGQNGSTHGGFSLLSNVDFEPAKQLIERKTARFVCLFVCFARTY